MEENESNAKTEHIKTTEYIIKSDIQNPMLTVTSKDLPTQMLYEQTDIIPKPSKGKKVK